MDKFATLEPVRLYNNSSPSSATPSTNRFSIHKPQTLPLHSRTKSYAPFQLIGRLPVDLHIVILTHLAVPDIPAYARCSRALGNLAKDERVWEARWKAFGVERYKLEDVLDSLEEKVKVQNGLDKNHAPPTLATESLDDEFGDFASINPQSGEMGDFVGAFSLSSPRTNLGFPQSSTKTSRALYIRAHALLKPLIPALSSPPHAVLSNLFSSPTPSLRHQAHTLRLLSLFLSSHVKPLRPWDTLSAALRAAIDRFEDGLLTAFDVADGKSDEQGMAEAAEASWEVWHGSGGEWELGKVWAEKLEIFYEQSKWTPLDNFTYVPVVSPPARVLISAFSKDSELDFTPMDEFIAEILAVLQEHGARAVRVFPPESNVLLSFADRIAHEVVSKAVPPSWSQVVDIACYDR